MRVEMTPQNFRAANVLRIRQCYPKNQNNPGFYRTITEFLREYNLPANISNGNKGKIDITYITDVAMSKLKELGIGYAKIKK